MAFCEYCKTQGQKTKNCRFCGKVITTEKVQFVYGPEENLAAPAEVTLTTRYLLVRDLSKGGPYKGTAAQEALSQLDSTEAEAIQKAKQAPYGYYDLQELQRVDFPFRFAALRFVNRDGTCFSIRFKRGTSSVKASKKFAKQLTRAGVSVQEDATITYYVCSPAPFVRKDNFGLRVCHSAAPFVNKLPGQFVAAPIPTTDEVQDLGEQSEPLVPTTRVVPGEVIAVTPKEPEPPAVPAEPVAEPPAAVAEPVAPVAPVATPVAPPAAPVAPQPTPAAPVAPIAAPVAPPAPTPAPPVKRFCPACGTAYPLDARFCPSCGAPI